MRVGIEAGLSVGLQVGINPWGQQAFAFSGVGTPGSIYLVGDDGVPRWSSSTASPWNGQYNEYENGGAGSGDGGGGWLTSPAGTGAARTALTGEAGWFQNPCALDTGTTLTGRVTLSLGAGVGISIDATSGAWVYEATFSIPTLSDGTERFSVNLGFQDNVDPFLVQHGAYLRYRDDNNSGKLEFVTSANSVRSTADTGITVTAGSYYHARIEIIDNTVANAWVKTIYDAGAGSPAFSDDGVWGAAQWTLSTNLPSGSAQEFTGGIHILKVAGTTTRRLKLGYQRCWRTPNFAGNPAVAGDIGTCLRIDETGSPAWIPPHRIMHPIVFHAFGRGGFLPSAPADMYSQFGVSGSASASAVDNEHMGLTNLNTGANAAGYAVFSTAYNLNLDSTVSPMVIESCFDLPTLSNGTQAYNAFVGLFDGAGSHANGITLEIDSNANTKAQCRCTSGGVTTTADSGVTIVAATRYVVRLVITSTSVDFYLKADGAAAYGAPVATITTNIPGLANMAAGLGIRKSVGTTSRNIRFMYCQAYQRSSTWTPAAQSGALNIQVAAAGFGRSSSSVLGTYDQGEMIMIEDDNSDTGTTPVVAHALPNPRTHTWALSQTAHMSLWGSSDLLASGDASGADSEHPLCWTIGCTGSPGHVGVGNGGGIGIVVLSATSHTRFCDFAFKIPTLSDGTNTFNSRLGWASALFGTVVNGVFMEVDSNTSAQMQFVTRAASIETRTASGITIAANTWYRGRIVVTNNTRVDYYLALESAGLPSTPTATITTTIPSGTGQGMLHNYLIEQTAGASARKLPVQHYLAGMDRFTS